MVEKRWSSVWPTPGLLSPAVLPPPGSGVPAAPTATYRWRLWLFPACTRLWTPRARAGLGVLPELRFWGVGATDTPTKGLCVPRGPGGGRLLKGGKGAGDPCPLAPRGRQGPSTLGRRLKAVLGPGIAGLLDPKSGFCPTLHTPSQFTLLGPPNPSLPGPERTPLRPTVGVVLPGQPGVEPPCCYSQDHSRYESGGIRVTLGQPGGAT